MKTKGNKNLKPEEAFTKEVGVRFLKKNFSALFALYNRESKNLILPPEQKKAQ